jgi:cellobiose phosphorylase
LTLIGFADWNDCFNLMGPKKAAETVWVAQFLHWAARAMIDLAQASGKSKDISKFEEILSWTKEKVNKYAWDGQWYTRAFTDDGAPVGSKVNKEGKIDLIVQTWAVISGIGHKNQLVSCMNAVKKYLDCQHGLMLISPPYTSFDPKIGAMGTFAPGLKENGGIFCHANPWAMIAETILGRGDLAFEYYKKIAPITTNKIAHIHKTEGYVYSQFIAGTSHTEPGRARNSWLTGSAAWNFTAGACYILGIRPDYAGLMVDPCIPRRWSGFKVRRYFRGAWYNIEVTNPKHVSKGVKSVNVDGRAVKSNILPVFNDQKGHKVKVIMGGK